MAEPFRLAIAGSWEYRDSPWPRRACISVAVVALHLMLILGLIAAQWASRRAVAPAAADVIWMTLEQLTPPEPAPIESEAPRVETMPTPAPAALQPAPTISAPRIAAPSASAAPDAPTAGGSSTTDRKVLDALKPYVLCGVPDDGRPIPENAQPCDDVRWGLLQKPLPGRPPTEAELTMKREFERAYAVENSPALIPCASGLMLNPLCVLGGVLNGFDFTMGSYADRGEPDCGPGGSSSGPCATRSSRPTVGGLLPR